MAYDTKQMTLNAEKEPESSETRLKNKGPEQPDPKM